MLEIDDETDFSAARTFDSKNWLEKTSIVKIGKKEVKEIPKSLMSAYMTKKFSMPEAPQLPSDGALSIKMSAPIQVYDATKLLKNKKRRLAQGDQTKTLELTRNEELVLVDSYMKLSGSIKV